jgi:hypothetical protein
MSKSCLHRKLVILTPFGWFERDLENSKDSGTSPENLLKIYRKNGVWGNMPHSGQVVWLAPEMVTNATFQS